MARSVKVLSGVIDLFGVSGLKLLEKQEMTFDQFVKKKTRI